MARKKKEAPLEPKPTKVEIETFREPDSHWLGQLRQDKPSCLNGDVRIRRYRIVAELIDEPVEVVAARLQELWDECDNHHHWDPLRAAARRIGYQLVGNAGSLRKKA
jgi:hypothetical protein